MARTVERSKSDGHLQGRPDVKMDAGREEPATRSMGICTFSVGKLTNVGGETFDSGLRIGVLVESAFDFRKQPIANFAILLVGRNQIGTSFFNLEMNKNYHITG
jgi:hypothetical protein